MFLSEAGTEVCVGIWLLRQPKKYLGTFEGSWAGKTWILRGSLHHPGQCIVDMYLLHHTHVNWEDDIALREERPGRGALGSPQPPPGGCL